jgi:hypothetical protein
MSSEIPGPVAVAKHLYVEGEDAIGIVPASTRLRVRSGVVMGKREQTNGQ